MINLKADIGIDQLDDNEFQLSLYDTETGLVVCQVYGTTVEEVEERAKIIEESVNLYYNG